MKKLFLSSSFKDVANLFAEFVNEDLKGKTVTFIPTASIPYAIHFHVNLGRKALEKLGMRTEELEISKATTGEIYERLNNNDYIFVAGGNTFFLLQELKKKGADRMIIEQIHFGKIFIGESAGSMIVSPNITYAKGMDSHKIARELDEFSSLNIVEFYPLPHYTNFPFKKSVKNIIAQYETKLNLIPISNSQAILVEGTEVQVVTI